MSLAKLSASTPFARIGQSSGCPVVVAGGGFARRLVGKLLADPTLAVGLPGLTLAPGPVNPGPNDADSFRWNRGLAA